jgi:hypothetical protein
VGLGVYNHCSLQLCTQDANIAQQNCKSASLRLSSPWSPLLRDKWMCCRLRARALPLCSAVSSHLRMQTCRYVRYACTRARVRWDECHHLAGW